MTDAKKWVTVKIPEGVRDEAREDPRTYGEIMESGLEETYTENEYDSLEGEVAELRENVESLLDSLNYDVTN